MADLLLTIEVAVGLLIAVAVTALLSLIGRRKAIARGALLTLAGLRLPEGHWRRGYARFGDGSLEWFALNGVSTRPAHAWTRRELELDAPTPLPGDVQVGLDGTLVVVPCRHSGTPFELALTQSAYMALRSWAEGAPPESVSAVN